MNSSVLTWPDRATVDRAVRAWAAAERAHRADLRRIGYFGSYARGDWGPGSDLDLVAVVTGSAEPFERRALAWDTTPLPVPADLLVYTEPEWQALETHTGRFGRQLAKETVWV